MHGCSEISIVRKPQLVTFSVFWAGVVEDCRKHFCFSGKCSEVALTQSEVDISEAWCEMSKAGVVSGVRLVLELSSGHQVCMV